MISIHKTTILVTSCHVCKLVLHAAALPNTCAQLLMSPYPTVFETAKLPLQHWESSVFMKCALEQLTFVVIIGQSTGMAASLQNHSNTRDFKLSCCVVICFYVTGLPTHYYILFFFFRTVKYAISSHCLPVCPLMSFFHYTEILLRGCVFVHV